MKLDEFLVKYANKYLEFAIELKDRFIEKEVLDLIYKYNISDKVIITSFH